MRVGAGADSVRLHAWVNRYATSAGPQRRPVLLELDNYTLKDNSCPTALPTGEPGDALATEISDRFTLVHVNLRGTGPSEGAFDMVGPRTQADVKQVVAWARSQPWSNGDIVLIGWSGTGIAIPYALGEPGIRAAVILTSCADLFRCKQPGGVFNALSELFLTIVSASYTSGLEARLRHGLVLNPPAPVQVAAIEQAYVTLRTSSVYDGFWQTRSWLGLLRAARVPVLFATDPYDIQTSFDAFAATPGARFVLGLGHTSTGAQGTAGSRHAELVRGPVDRFVRRYGLREPVDLRGDQAVTLVTNTGSFDTWNSARALVRGETSWPLPSTLWTRLFLDGARSGTARSRNDGSLRASPGGLGADSSPLVGGPDHYADFRFVNERGDGVVTDLSGDEAAALTYTSPMLVEDVEVSGPISVRLIAATSARDFDWTVRLTDVWPDGRSEWITDGQLRASLRRVDPARSLRNRSAEIVRPFLPLDRVEPVPGGRPVEYLFELVPTSNVFRAGHRIRLDLFPIAASGPDVGSVGAAGDITVLRGPGGSSVLLPLIPARCHLGRPMHAATEPVSCARSWASAIAPRPAPAPHG